MKNIDVKGKGTINPHSAGTALSGAILTGRHAAAHIHRRLASRAWWLIVACERQGIAFCSHIERTYYSGSANKDFELVVMPAMREGFGFVGLFLARKTRMSADRLQREIADRVGPISVEELLERDVLFPHPDVKVAAALAEFVVDFLKGRPRPEDN